MSFVFLPYSVPVKELTRVEVIDFDINKYFSCDALDGLDSILILTENGLSVLKSDSDILYSINRYQVFNVDDKTGDLSGSLSERDVILSFIPNPVWGVGDELDTFIPDYNQEYVVVTNTGKPKNRTPIWAFCIELFFRFGVKFFYTNTSNGRYVIHIKEDREDIFTIMKNNKTEIEEAYSISLSFKKAPAKKVKVFDF